MSRADAIRVASFAFIFALATFAVLSAIAGKAVTPELILGAALAWVAAELLAYFISGGGA